VAQVPEHCKSFCPTCKADRGEPCENLDGTMSEKVHYGRPYWSSQVRRYVKINWEAFGLKEPRDRGVERLKALGL